MELILANIAGCRVVSVHTDYTKFKYTIENDPF